MARSCRCFGLVVCLLVGLPLVQAYAQGSNDFTKGVRLYQDGDYEGAVKALEAATAANPNEESAWYFLGMSRFELSDFPGALTAFEQSQALSPTRPGTHLMIGKLYEVTGAYDQAVGVYQDELRLRRGKDLQPVMCAIGRVLYLDGRPAEAKVPLLKVISENPNYVEALYYLGLSEFAGKQYEMAVKHFTSGLEIMDAWRMLARRRDLLKVGADSGQLTAEQQRLYGEAQEQLAQQYGSAEEFGTVLRLWPALNLALGDAQLALGNYATARNAYRKALDQEQRGSPADPDPTTRIARAYLQDGKALFTDEGMLLQAVAVLEAGITEAKAALTKKPGYAPAHIVLGEIYLFQADTYVTRADLDITSHTPADALTEFEKALQAEPDNIRALSLAADCLLQLGRSNEALNMAQRALALAPKDDSLHSLLAKVLLAQEDAEGAMRSAQTALSMNKRNVDALNVAGKIYMYYQGDMGEAIQHYTDATLADPRDADSFINLGLAFFQMESWHRARREFERALALIPTATVANTAEQQAYLYYLIARTYHQAGMYDKEIAALNESLGRHPASLQTLRQLALAYEGRKEYRAAERVLGDALGLSGGEQDDAQINLQLGAMYEQEGRPHEAIAAYTSALQADPNLLDAQKALERLQYRAPSQ